MSFIFDRIIGFFDLQNDICNEKNAQQTYSNRPQAPRMSLLAPFPFSRSRNTLKASIKGFV
jgi:hypothetical protein